MKKTIFTISILAGLVAYSYGQGNLGSAGSFTSVTDLYGSISLDNTANGNLSETANIGGLVWIGNTFATAGLLDPSNPLYQDVNVALYDGSSLIVSMTLDEATGGATGQYPNGAASGDSLFGGGLFLDPSETTYYDLLAAGGATRTLTLDLWTGNYSTYAAAAASNLSTVYFGTATFSQPFGNVGTPASTATDLTSMPALVMLPAVPEPTAIALATLGGLSLLGLRRRKAA
jgi:hypothetical protein